MAVTVMNAASLMTRLFDGNLNKQRGVYLRRSSEFTVERTGPGPLHTDGEVHDAGTKIEFRIRPLSLRIIAPVERSGLR